MLDPAGSTSPASQTPARTPFVRNHVPPAGVSRIMGIGLLTTALIVAAAPAAASASTPTASTPTASVAAATRTVLGTQVVGLYGSQDPTYDGVYRQGLSILSLRAVQVSVPVRATRWLLHQQCADGGFQSFRANTHIACAPTDLNSYAGEDTNSTAVAALALSATGQSRAAARARAWLRASQNTDGGFPYLRGAGSDANSTGLAIATLRGSGFTAVTLRKAGRAAESYLRSLQLRCTYNSRSRGALAYQGGSVLVANDFATAQALTGLASTLPVVKKPLRRVPLTLACTNGVQTSAMSTRDAGAGYLARRLLRGHGQIPNAFGPGVDWNATAWSVLALAGARTGGAGIAIGSRALLAHVKDYAFAGLVGRPAALATLILVAHATGADPRRYGRWNLISYLQRTLG